MIFLRHYAMSQNIFKGLILYIIFEALQRQSRLHKFGTSSSHNKNALWDSETVIAGEQFINSLANRVKVLIFTAKYTK